MKIADSSIDIVIPWVCALDPTWQAQFRKYKNEIKTEDGNQTFRYRGIDSLKYVLRGIDSYLPWINKIYLVTNGQSPSWLNSENKKLSLVSHRQIFPDTSVLPTFNALAITLNIHNIEGLSEKFILFDDDMLVLSETDSSRFFVYDKPTDFLHQIVPLRSLIFKDRVRASLWKKNIKNAIDCINCNFSKKEILLYNKEIFYSSKYSWKIRVSNFICNFFSRYYSFAHYHHPQPYLKSNLDLCHKIYSERILTTTNSRFRSENDLVYLFRYVALVRGDFYPFFDNDHETCEILNESSVAQFESALRNNRFVCINDQIDLSDPDYKNIAQRLIELLEYHFPHKSTFEK